MSWNKIFDNMVLVLIILSSVTLILDNPLDEPTSPLKTTLYYVDMIFTLLFTLEALIKIIGKGLLYSSLPI